MLPAELYSRLLPSYTTYAEVFMPLIAEIEARYELFPQPLLNEIRAYNDYVARCHVNIDDTAFVGEQIRKAEGHIERMVCDCYKFLHVQLYKNTIDSFEKRTKHARLTIINNGGFEESYQRHKAVIVGNLIEAKQLEFQDNVQQAIICYRTAHSEYMAVEAIISQNESYIRWAVESSSWKKFVKFVWWLLSAIISGIIGSMIIPFQELFKWLLQ